MINDGIFVAPHMPKTSVGAQSEIGDDHAAAVWLRHGYGYPKERAVSDQRNKKILAGVKVKSCRPLTDTLKDLDSDFVNLMYITSILTAIQ